MRGRAGVQGTAVEVALIGGGRTSTGAGQLPTDKMFSLA